MKKFLALVLAMLMVVSAAATVSAFDDVDAGNIYYEAINNLVTYKIVKGKDADGKIFDPDGDVTRLQLAIMMSRALTAEVESDALWQNGITIFPDVDEYKGAIEFASTEGIITGYPDGNFLPNAGVSYIEALTMATRALGYDDGKLAYPMGYYTKAKALGLTKDVQVYDLDQALTRAETAQIIFNMIRIVPADGGMTIEAANFGVATTENTTTFVITATPKQAYAEGYNANEAGYVGLQLLENGVPTGDIAYYNAAALGITGNVENYLSYTVDLVNYNAKTGAFTSAEIGEAADVVYSTAVTAADTKFTVAGKAYYPVENITGAALKNEIVVINGGATATKAKMPLFDKDGNIVDIEGVVKARFAYTTASGAKYYADVLNKEVITEAAAIELFGVYTTDGAYTKYATMTAADIKASQNYQLKLFDDNGDGKYDRAIYTPVYMSVYTAKDSDGYDTVIKNLTGNKVKDADITYTDASVKTKGTIFVYTWNEQAKIVDVIDVLELQDGTIDKIDTTKYVKGNTNNADKSTIKITIDGTAYNVAKINDQKVGAKILTNGAPGSIAKIVSDAKLDYFDHDAFIATAKVGALVKFYEFNGYIIYAETYSLEDKFDIVVLDEYTSYDSAAVYADLYKKGVVAEDVEVSKFDGKVLADLSIFKYADFLNTITSQKPGTIYKAVALGDGTTELGASLKRYDANSIKSFKLLDSGLYDVDFLDGISDNTNKALRIRTNASTVFYFIDETYGKESVVAYVGAPEKGSIINADQILVDKLGYGSGSNNGVASIVIVYNATKITGFGLSEIATVSAFVNSSLNPTDKIVVNSAKAFGLPSNYTGNYYYYSNVAVNLETGAVLSLYSCEKLEAGHIYEVDKNNVVLYDDVAEALVETPSVDLAVFTTAADMIDFDDQYITSSALGIALADKVTTVKATKADSIAIKTSKTDVLNILKDAAYVGGELVMLADGLDDGVLVIVCAKKATLPPPPPPAGQATLSIVNAIYNNGSDMAANFDGKTITMLSDVAYVAEATNVTGTKVDFGAANYGISSIAQLDADGYSWNAYTVPCNLTATINANNNLDVVVAKDAAYPGAETALDAGVYEVVIDNDVTADLITIYIIVK